MVTGNNIHLEMELSSNQTSQIYPSNCHQLFSCGRPEKDGESTRKLENASEERDKPLKTDIAHKT